MKITKFVSWLTPILALSLVCSFTLTATAQNYYPSEIGNAWTLLSADGTEQRTYEILEAEGIEGEGLFLLKISTQAIGTETVVIDDYFVSVVNGDLLLHQSRTDEGAFGIAEATFDPPATFFPAALPIGHQWEIVTNTELQLVGATTSTSTIEVIAIEDVETPAGTFENCVKLQINQRAVTALTVIRYEFIQWLAPDVGPIKFQDVLQDITFELESYNLVEPPAGEEAAAEEMPDAEEAPAGEEASTAEAEMPAEGVGETTETESETEAEMPVSQMFEITLTNLTMGEAGMGGQILSPPIFAAHLAGVNIAPVGEAASPALIALAENGDTSGLAAIAAAANASIAMADSVVPPGGSVTVTVTADMVNASLSVAAMLVSTNDAFIAATDVALFDAAGMPVSTSLELMAYDAGSEENTEMASDIPGPLGLDAAVDPEGSNERVPTEGGVVAAHEGIQGVGDVGEAFAWSEPTAMLTITPAAAPVAPEPMPEPEPEPEPIGPGFDVALEPGLNMISIPLMPEEPYTAKSLAEMIGATIVIQLNAATQHFVGYTVADGGDGFGIEGGKGYIVNTPAGGIVKFTGSAWDNQPEPEPPVEEPAVDADAGDDAADDDAAEGDMMEAEGDMEAEGEMPEEGGDDDMEADAGNADDAADDAAAAEEVADAAADAAPADDAAAAADAAAAPALSTFKSAWAFIVTSDIQGMDTGTTYTLVAENLRTGTLATQNITTGVSRSSAVWADLNRKSVIAAGDTLEVALYDDRGRVVSGPFQRTVTTTDIRNAFLGVDLTVGDVRPQETILAQNFPNPFNPETWIPYQLSASTEVSIQIYDVSGRLVRTLDLGWQPVGSYMTPSSAAYWDGRNAVGEHVASGIYFYTLQTSDFAATRRMVILK